VSCILPVVWKQCQCRRTGEIDIPQLRTLKCYWPYLPIRCHRSRSGSHSIELVFDALWLFNPTSTSNNIRHHLSASRKLPPFNMRSILAIFFRPETIADVDAIKSDVNGVTRSDSVPHYSLRSITLPLSSDDQPVFITIFDGFQLSVLHKLTIVGTLNKLEVDRGAAQLAERNHRSRYH
jgi:hypothetical protein